MSQAEKVPTTSRRSFMRGAAIASAALPASAGAALAMSAGTCEHELLAFETEISQAWEHLGSVCGIHEVAEKRLAAWQNANPKPTLREPTTAEKKDFLHRVLNGEGLSAKFGEDYEKASAEHERALKAWKTRHEAAKQESGYNRAHELEGLANSRLRAAIEAMAVTRARTVEGIRCKARASAKIEEWASTEPDLAYSIVEDFTGPTS
jgi:hypothetical protein